MIVGAVVDGATVWESSAGVPAIVGGVATTQVDVPLVLTTAAIPRPLVAAQRSPERLDERRTVLDADRKPQRDADRSPEPRPLSRQRRRPRADGSPTPEPTASPTPEPSASPTPSPTAAPTASPSATPSPGPERDDRPAERRPHRDARLPRVVPAVRRRGGRRGPGRGQGQGDLQPDHRDARSSIRPARRRSGSNSPMTLRTSIRTGATPCKPGSSTRPRPGSPPRACRSSRTGPSGMWPSR